MSLDRGFSTMRIATTILCSGLLAALTGPALADCTIDLANVERGVQSLPWQDVELLVRKIDASITCEPWEQTKANGLLSTKLIFEAKRIDPELKKLDAAALIEKAAKLDVDWRSLELHGKIQRSAGKFRDAAISFQEAINLIANSDGAGGASASAWKNEAGKSDRANLAIQADEAKHLAAAGSQGVLVAAASDRAGNPGGVFSAAVDRGAVGVRVPAPILFEFNSAQLTRVGREAAEEIATFLKARDPKSITVAGHTDHVGSEAYNRELSRKRAGAIAGFLKESGVSAKIKTVGKGYSEPWKLSQGATFTQAQIDELNRRVEFDWN
jgi:outer membrane protein OmpA-like peptidoglycan-associated protein